MKKLILAAAALALSTSAMAGPKWTYADLGYIVGDSGDEDTDGYRVSGSFGFADIWHVGLNYNDAELNGGQGSNFAGADADFFEVSVGVNPALTDNTDFVFDVSYFDGSIESGSGLGASDDDFDGYGLRVGLRSYLTDNMEVWGFINSRSGSIDMGSSPSMDFTDVGVSAGGQYFFTENVSVGADVFLNGVSAADADIANFFVRYSF